MLWINGFVCMGLLKELNTVERSTNPLQILEIFPPKQYFSLQSRVKEEEEEGGEGEGNLHPLPCRNALILINLHMFALWGNTNMKAEKKPQYFLFYPIYPS